MTLWEDAADGGCVLGDEGAAGGDSIEILVVYDDEVGGGALLEGCGLVCGHVLVSSFRVMFQMT